MIFQQQYLLAFKKNLIDFFKKKIIKNPMRVIGLGCYRFSGKDTLFSLLNKYGKNRYVRYAFADALKKEIKQEILDKYNLDILTATPEEKENVRHLLIEHGVKKRKEDKDHWAKIVYSQIIEDVNNCYAGEFIPVITDVRYLNEVNFFKEKFGRNFSLVTITREGYGAGNKEEAKNSSLVYLLPESIQFHWKQLDQYSEQELKEKILNLESKWTS